MAACKTCEKPVVWAETASGKTIMLEEVRDPEKAEVRGSWLMLGGLRLRVAVKGKEKWAALEDQKLHRTFYFCHWDVCGN